MKYWASKVIEPYIQDFGYKSICEIGASDGKATDKICGLSNIHISIIDPCFDVDLVQKYKHKNNITVYNGLSLEILPTMAKEFDCFLIDGDHNWYTVYHELTTIHERNLLTDGGTIFFHDVGWPYAKRDMYYQPDSIPKEYRHPFSTNGMIYGQSTLSPTHGRGRGLCNAEHEGGPKNGVLMAIEDFLDERGNDYFLFRFTDECGLGVLVKRSGLKSRSRLVKWFLFSRFWNVFAIPKTIIYRKFPNLYGFIKKLILAQ